MKADRREALYQIAKGERQMANKKTTEVPTEILTLLCQAFMTYSKKAYADLADELDIGHDELDDVIMFAEPYDEA